MKNISISVAAFLLAFSFFARAEEASDLAGRNYDEAHEAEVAKTAKKRLYPGGKDESDLKVQSQLSTPTRKMAPTVNVNTGVTGGGEAPSDD